MAEQNKGPIDAIIAVLLVIAAGAMVVYAATNGTSNTWWWMIIASPPCCWPSWSVRWPASSTSRRRPSRPRPSSGGRAQPLDAGSSLR